MPEEKKRKQRSKKAAKKEEKPVEQPKKVQEPRKEEKPKEDEKKVRTKATLTWLRDLLAWCSEDPINRIETVVEELTKHSNEIQEAFAEAIDPEFKDYMNFIVNSLTAMGGGNGSGA